MMQTPSILPVESTPTRRTMDIAGAVDLLKSHVGTWSTEVVFMCEGKVVEIDTHVTETTKDAERKRTVIITLVPR
jgi:hypothetical protein